MGEALGPQWPERRYGGADGQEREQESQSSSPRAPKLTMT